MRQLLAAVSLLGVFSQPQTLQTARIFIELPDSAMTAISLNGFMSYVCRQSVVLYRRLLLAELLFGFKFEGIPCELNVPWRRLPL